MRVKNTAYFLKVKKGGFNKYDKKWHKREAWDHVFLIATFFILDVSVTWEDLKAFFTDKLSQLIRIYKNK